MILTPKNKNSRHKLKKFDDVHSAKTRYSIFKQTSQNALITKSKPLKVT